MFSMTISFLTQIYFCKQNKIYEMCLLFYFFLRDKFWPGRKLGELGNFFPRFLNPSFRFWLWDKIENLEIRKLGILFPRFPKFSRFLSFRFATFSFFKKPFLFNILQQGIPYFLSMLCFVSKPLKVFFSSPKIYVQNITLP